MVQRPPEDVVFRPLTVRIGDACQLTGIGRSKLYELIAAGEIEITKVDAITLIPVASLRSFLQAKASFTTPL
jgi:excisionase family DNA binding protein